MYSPLVSVIIPVYKCEKYIRKCIDSIISQTYENIEVILIIDGNFDNSGAICREYEDIDNRICVIEKENEGVSVARNTGIDTCKGDWIVFVDSDDWLDKDYIRKMVYVAERHESDIIMCDFKVEYQNNNANCMFLSLEEGYIESNREKLLQSCIITTDITSSRGFTNIGVPWSKMYKAIFVNEKGLRFVPGLKRMQDTIFNLYAFKEAENIYYYHDYLYHYVRNEDASTIRNMSDFDKIAQMFMAEVNKFIMKTNSLFLEEAIYDRTIILILEMIKLKYISDTTVSVRQKISSIKKVIYDKKLLFYNNITKSKGYNLTRGESIVRFLLKIHFVSPVYLYAYRQVNRDSKNYIKV